MNSSLLPCGREAFLGQWRSASPFPLFAPDHLEVVEGACARNAQAQETSNISR
jgi:hypothetical protein